MLVYLSTKPISPILRYYYSSIDDHFLHKPDQTSDKISFPPGIQPSNSICATFFPNYPLDHRGVILPWHISVCNHLHLVIVPHTLLWI